MNCYYDIVFCKILGLIKELKEARASIEFLEDENRLLKEKARNDDTSE